MANPFGPGTVGNCGCCDCGTICTKVTGCGTLPLEGATVTVTLNYVTSLTVTNGGNSYTVAPTVTIALPVLGTDRATATAVLDGSGHVASVTVTHNGSGYSGAAPAVTWSGGGGGSGAAATAVLASSTVGTCTTTGDGTVERAVITAAGTGYTSTPTVTFSAPSSGTTATGTAVRSGNTIASITITNAGTGYGNTAPTITFGGPGTGAAATALLFQSCCIGIPSAATYNVTANKAGFQASATSNLVSTCTTNNKTVALSTVASTHVCCNGFTCADPMPKQLYLTDANVTASAMTFITSTPPTWRLCYTFTAPNVCSGSCVSGSGTMAVRHGIVCVGDGSWAYTEQWIGTTCSGLHLMSASTCPVEGFVSSGSTCDLGATVCGTALNLVVSSCSPFAASLSNPTTGSNSSPTPVPGTVTISA